MLEPRVELAKCKHYYHYYLDPVYGLRYTRLQSWFPFTMHIGLNGRDWLGQQLMKAGISFRKQDNCFSWVDDFAAAQKFADKQRTTNWPRLLGRWVRESHRLAEGFLPCPVPYYWSVETGEYATDFAFRSAEELQRVFIRCWWSTLGPSCAARICCGSWATEFDRTANRAKIWRAK